MTQSGREQSTNCSMCDLDSWQPYGYRPLRRVAELYQHGTRFVSHTIPELLLGNGRRGRVSQYPFFFPWLPSLNMLLTFPFIESAPTDFAAVNFYSAKWATNIDYNYDLIDITGTCTYL